jgi:transcriptional regulator with XRE-family HTH domain
MGVKAWYNEDREYENLINEIRVEQGLTLKDLASKIGISQGHMWHISHAYTGPYHSTGGRLKDWAIKLQEVFGYDLSEIFPREVCSLQTSNLTNGQLAFIAHGYTGPNYGDSKIDRLFKYMSMRNGIRELLTPRERIILHYRYERGEEFSYISKVIGFSNQRCRQVEWRAMRVLRGYMDKSLNTKRTWCTGWMYKRKGVLRSGQLSLIPKYPFDILLQLLPKNSMFA